YSIIEQGKVDAMLLASPQDRRTIFEEAAGIARYKQRRIESTRKLDRTEVNLTRAREQLESTERRLRIVKGQAARARRFRELDSELSAIRMAVAFDQYHDLRQRLDGLTSELTALEAVRTEAHEQLAQMEAQKQQAEIDRHELAETVRRIEADRQSAIHDAEQAEQRVKMTEAAIAEAQARLETDAAQIREMQARREELQRTEGRLRSQIETAQARLEQTEQAMTQAGEARAAVLEQLADTRAELAERQAAVAGVERERASLLASIQADTQRCEHLCEQITGIERKQSSATTEQQRLNTEYDEAQRLVASHRETVERLSSELAGKEAQASSLAAGRSELAERVNELEQQRVRLDSRRLTLEEMDANRAGFGDAVRTVLEHRDRGEGFAGVLGAVADLIETDHHSASAVEAALGSSLQSLVVRSPMDLPCRDDIAALDGRVTFLPMIPIGIESCTVEARAPIDAVLAAGRVTAIRPLVRLRPEVVDTLGEDGQRLLDRLLGRTFLVEDLDAAMLLSTGVLGAGARFVTSDGSVLEADGRIIAGPNSVETGGEGVLRRHAELDDLRMKLDRLDSELQSSRAELAETDERASRLSGLRAELRSQLAGEERQLAAVQARCERLDSERRRQAEAIESLAQDRDQLSSRLETIQREGEELRGRADRLESLLLEQRAGAESLDAQLTRLQIQADQMAEQVTAARVEAGAVREQLSSARRELSRLIDEAEQVDRRYRELVEHTERAKGAIQEHQRAIQTARDDQEAAARRQAELSESIEHARVSLAQAGERVDELAQRLAGTREHAQRIERNWHSLEVARREVEVKREHTEERTAEELGIQIDAEYEEYSLLLVAGDLLTLDQNEAQAECEALRSEIKKLGNVNLDAIDEESQLAGRNEDLIAQVKDLDEARTRLVDLIERLNTASKERFEETFTAVSENFAGPNGMFRRLFGGGKAEVRLMPLIKEIDGEKVQTDEIDLLESGVEVIARPPGKEPRTINQLSGGEKTMTAVALLLSIFQTKPSCFCILDEVDAALDDANVDRYCNVVRSFVDRSHFIVITHNKRTMQEADRLYGITMQERGVSKRVTVNVNDVFENGQIKESKATEEATPEKPLRSALASMRAENQPA
ncbi:MAG TPA: chromosome segregation protein SMC, partial [Phycisphaerales bacterium]|nr:chromosome segregation protein SMC [Phycisphaerales bacterium]